MRSLFGSMSPQKLRLLTLMCVIALLTLAADGEEDCCPNEEDGAPKATVIAMQVIVTPQAQEVESGSIGQVTVTTECSLPCPAIRDWYVSADYGILPLASRPNPTFSFETSIGFLGSLRNVDYDPTLNLLERRATLTFSPRIDGDFAGMTKVTGGTARVTITSRASEPEVAALRSEEGSLSLGSKEKNMGNVVVGGEFAGRIFVWNTGSIPATITGITISAIEPADALDHFEPHRWVGFPLTLAPGRSNRIIIRFKPKTAGKKQVLLQVEGQSEGKPLGTYTRISGTGVYD